MKILKKYFSFLLMFVFIVGCETQFDVSDPSNSNNLTTLTKEIPAGATIDAAVCSLYVDDTAGEILTVHRITAPWDEGVVTWNNFGGAYDPTVYGSFVPNVAGWVVVDITTLVQAWWGGTDNFGLLIRATGISESSFFTKESESPNLSPIFEIHYTSNGTPGVAVIQDGVEGEFVPDTFIRQNVPDGNYGGAPRMLVRLTTDYEKQTLIKFDLEATPEEECETAYAYGGTLATCFLDIPEANSNNWGWSNGLISPGYTGSWNIYAGAGQCDPTKGTLVGTLVVSYSGGTATVAYNIISGFTLDETHLYVGDEILARDKKGKFTTAPGQYPYSGEQSYTIGGLSGDIYIVAHAVVCGIFE